MIRFACPRCSHGIQCADSHAGRKGICPKCKASVPIPHQSTLAPPTLELDDAPPPPVRRRVNPPVYRDPVDELAAATAGPPMHAQGPTYIQIDAGPKRRPERSVMAMTMGIIALPFGLLGIAGSWVPVIGCLGLPFAGLAVLLGFIGCIASAANRFRGIGMPAAGLCVGVVAIGITIAATGTTMSVAASQAAASQAAEQQRLAGHPDPQAILATTFVSAEPQQFGKPMLSLRVTNLLSRGIDTVEFSVAFYDQFGDKLGWSSLAVERLEPLGPGESYVESGVWGSIDDKAIALARNGKATLKTTVSKIVYADGEAFKY